MNTPEQRTDSTHHLQDLAPARSDDELARDSEEPPAAVKQISYVLPGFEAQLSDCGGDSLVCLRSKELQLLDSRVKFLVVLPGR